jgi:hypothetical protein
VAIVERLLPRYWDGRRLLRFLAGLALLALAFAVRVDAVAAAPPPAPATSVVSTTVDAPPATGLTETDRSVATVDAPPPTVDAPLTGPVGSQVAPAAAVVEPETFAAGIDQPAYGSRGPPRA